MSKHDIVDLEPIDSDDARARGDALRAWGWVSYLLHLIVAVAAVVPGLQVGVTLLVVALVMDLVKKDDAAGTWQASHFSWRIRSVLWSGVLYVVTFPFYLLGLFLFNPAWVLVSIWFLYRIVKGMTRMGDGQPVD